MKRCNRCHINLRAGDRVIPIKCQFSRRNVKRQSAILGHAHWRARGLAAGRAEGRTAVPLAHRYVIRNRASGVRPRREFRMREPVRRVAIDFSAGFAAVARHAGAQREKTHPCRAPRAKAPVSRAKPKSRGSISVWRYRLGPKRVSLCDCPVLRARFPASHAPGSLRQEGVELSPCPAPTPPEAAPR
ncbi:unnamed protein product, partial [Iphiclides podalirius]